MVSIQRPEYGGGEIYFDGKLIRKERRVSSETTAFAKLALIDSEGSSRQARFGALTGFRCIMPISPPSPSSRFVISNIGAPSAGDGPAPGN